MTIVFAFSSDSEQFDKLYSLFLFIIVLCMNYDVFHNLI